MSIDCSTTFWPSPFKNLTETYGRHKIFYDQRVPIFVDYRELSRSEFMDSPSKNSTSI